MIKCIPAITEAFDGDNKPSIKRVAVYARVSTALIGQTTSYELQKNYYTDMVNKHKEWTLAGVYADEGITATSMKYRQGFKSMLAACERGEIDIILTKSIARFSRNIVDCIKTIRMLKELPNPVEVIFEIEGIHTFDASTEMKLNFLATVAQEESHIRSTASITSIDQRFSRGVFLIQKLYGYDKHEDHTYTINENEADIVRLCFFLKILGRTITDIALMLNNLKVPTIKGIGKWQFGQIARILENEKYHGDYLARKTYMADYLEHKHVKNKNNRPMYLQRNHHPAIISKELFEAVSIMSKKWKTVRRKSLPAKLEDISTYTDVVLVPDEEVFSLEQLNGVREETERIIKKLMRPTV